MESGTIIDVKPVELLNGAHWSMKTVVYERTGLRYLGCQNYQGLFSFNGDGAATPFFVDIDEAWKASYRR